ncbi:MAG: lipopolysaccharide heptosyltransferase II [Zetaproteobacteria bacterium CG2_30_59_37]|nr:MAG: lipopolysaccharide heptosyltransferase II [Zetaproteobacteria bacterium CG2_30_59_37]
MNKGTGNHPGLRCDHLVLHAPNWLGDVIMAQPAMHAFASGAQAEKIQLTGKPWLADILPWLNLPGAEYIPEGSHGGDAFVVFPNSFRSAVRAVQSGAKRRIGYRGQWRSLLLSDALTPRIDMLTGHHRTYFNDLAIFCGIEVKQPEVHLACPDAHIQAGRQWMQQNGLDAGNTVCIAPGAQFGGAKRYPAERWAKVAQLLSGRGLHILALGTPAEREIAAQVLSSIQGPCMNSAGSTTLAQCLQLLSASRGLLCNDSGLMHVAAGMGKQVVTVFGATDPVRTAPSGPHVHLIYHPAACSPCLKRECVVAGQPCMANIAPEEVAAAFSE